MKDEADMVGQPDKLTGPYLLVPIKGTGEVLTNAGRYKADFLGELLLASLSRAADGRRISVERFGLAISGVKARAGATGTISVLGDAAVGSRRSGKRETQIELQFRGRINYQLLDEARGARQEARCYVLPAFDPCLIQVSLTLVERGGESVVTAGRVLVSVVEGLGDIFTIAIALSAVATIAVNPPAGINRFQANSPYDPCTQVNRRTLTCLPVAFQDSATDTAPSGISIAAQFAKAQQVWDKACIAIDVLPTHMITDATLKISDQWQTIMNSYTDSATNVIEVFFVSNLLLNVGGGVAYVGTASAKAVIGEPNAGNPVLLSHELGHVLGLLHPNQTGSEPLTVMEPTGGPNNPGKEAVLHAMSQAIANPALATTTTPCCLSHDKPDHFIRDFPVDAGQEPSDPLPVGMTRYSMSNVWNRTTNTPGVWSAATGPDHESPYRFQSDGVTPATNYFFATVEQLNNFQVIGAQVKFYLKTPGSGSGAANLNLVGTATPISPYPSDASVAWTLPAMTPSHSCCFAVVTSPAEPEGMPSALDWWQFEDMCHQDNDWAQRNLDIIDISPNSGSGNVWEGAPWHVGLPESADIRRAPLSLRVSAGGAGLQAMEIEIPGTASYRVDPGRTAIVKTDRMLSPGEQCAVIVKAALSSRAARGAVVGLVVDPIVGERELVGFGTTFRLAGDRRAKRMFLDRTIAAAWDVAGATDQDHWHQLAFDLRGMAGDRSPHLRDIAKRILALKSLEESVGSAARWPLAETFGLPVAGKPLLDAIKKNDPDAVNASLWSFLTRAHMAVSAPAALASG